MNVCAFTSPHIVCLLIVHSLVLESRLIIKDLNQLWFCPWPLTSVAPAVPASSGVTYQSVKLLKNLGYHCANR